nr:uncharacterized protein LOC109154451 [Ipomoea batatas]
MAQVTKTITERARGALPSTTENNPRERVQAITLRSGKELPDPVLHKGSISKSPIEEENVKIHVEENAEQNTGTVALMHAKLIRSLHVLCLDFYVAHVTYHFVCRKKPAHETAREVLEQKTSQETCAPFRKQEGVLCQLPNQANRSCVVF